MECPRKERVYNVIREAVFSARKLRVTSETGVKKCEDGIVKVT
jgi:hypothetical protein